MTTFRAVWPIYDGDLLTLIKQAADDLPALVAQAHCRITGPPRFFVADSTKVPGSGRTTPQVLVCMAEAESVKRAIPSTPRADVEPFGRGPGNTVTCQRCGLRMRAKGGAKEHCRACWLALKDEGMPVDNSPEMRAG